MPVISHSLGCWEQYPLTGVVLVNLFSMGFAGSGRKRALISWVNALAVGMPIHNKTKAVATRHSETPRPKMFEQLISIHSNKPQLPYGAMASNTMCTVPK